MAVPMWVGGAPSRGSTKLEPRPSRGNRWGVSTTGAFCLGIGGGPVLAGRDRQRAGGAIRSFPARLMLVDVSRTLSGHRDLDSASR